jgi:hypothetical protein
MSAAPIVLDKEGKNVKLTTIVLASVFALSSTFALAKPVRHKPSVRTYELYSPGIRLLRPGFFGPNYNPDGAAGVSSGGYQWNGRSASELGSG